ncbi:unnamed protein product [[Candida] boidinii]|uniref:Unnamed protein product n=1 Tax=Candida boidinii TaxID=5477 RepID=A0A9W6SXB7_CANBO|nr:unnamed protein product [[Candida] boidinii]
MINQARACADDGASDTGPYNHDCLCAQGSDFQSLVASCLDCGWCLWEDYGQFLEAPLSECGLPSEPTGTACAPCPSSSGVVSSSASATTSGAVSTNIPSSVFSSLLSSAAASSSAVASTSASGVSEPSSSVCVRDTSPAAYQCHAYCGTMINQARACADDGASDTGPYNHDCLCAQGSDFQSLVASCLDCGWCLWEDYGQFLEAPLSECGLPSEPTGTACAPCPSSSSDVASSSASATTPGAVSTNIPSSVISSLLSSAAAVSSALSTSEPSASTCVREVTDASYQCHAACGMMINYARECTSDGVSDSGPYDHDCLCTEDSDFENLVASCLDCGWCLWDDYGKYLTAALSECSLPTEPTGTACAPCPEETSGSISVSASGTVREPASQSVATLDTITKSSLESAATSGTVTESATVSVSTDSEGNVVIVSKTNTERITTTSTLTSCSDGACTKKHTSKSATTETCTVTMGNTTKTITYCPRCDHKNEDNTTIDVTVTDNKTVTETTSCSTTEGAKPKETGSEEGSNNGSGEGSGEGSNNGSGEDSNNGSGEGSNNGSGAGNNNGSDEGSSNSSGAGSNNGSGEGSNNGSGEGSNNGSGSNKVSGEGSNNGSGDNGNSDVIITSTSFLTTTVCDAECQKTESQKANGGDSDTTEGEASTYEGSAPHVTIGISTFIVGFLVFLI